MSSTIAASDLAARLHLRKHPRSWRGACPACSYPRAFSLRVGKSDRPLPYCSNGCNTDTLRDALTRAAGGDWFAPPRDTTAETSARAHKQAASLRLWSSARDAPDTLADIYLRGRGLPGLATSHRLRFLSDTPHPEVGRLPAMLAAVSNVDGETIGVHRTYLDRATGGKAAIEPAKASLGPIWGGAIRLHPLASELVIGEGIESAASAGRLLSLPAWAAVSAGNLARGLVLPAEVRSVAVAVDPDPAGEAAARSAVERWAREGRRVRLARPSGSGDFNDVLQAQPPEVAHA